MASPQSVVGELPSSCRSALVSSASSDDVARRLEDASAVDSAACAADDPSATVTPDAFDPQERLFAVAGAAPRGSSLP